MPMMQPGGVWFEVRLEAVERLVDAPEWGESIARRVPDLVLRAA